MPKAHRSSSSEKTLPLKVANTGFLLDRLGEDCHPLQFLRELTQNSIDAILRTPARRGEIVWDVDWNSLDLDETGTYKLSVYDNGDGMTGDEMVKYLNHLSSSVSTQSLTGNYGVGAKIAAATRNHHGLIYLSWKSGRGSMVHLWRDPETGQYGLRQFQRGDGSFDHYAEVEDAVKPSIIDDHGTMVVLLGNSPEADTMEPPPNTPAPSRWISRYLNTRFFEIPAGIVLRAREGWKVPRTDKDRNLLRTLTGQRAYLDKHSTSAGTVRLSGALGHWWILRDEDAIGQNSGFVESSGHVAALYNNELYETASGRAATARLQHFGVLFGYRQVVIYAAPVSEDGRSITTNTARTTLLINNEPLPWSEWCAEFRSAMPKEIRDLIDAKAAATSAVDHTQSIRERLKNLMDLYRVSRYRATAGGSTLVDPDRTVRAGEGKSQSTSQQQTSTASRSATKGGQAGGIYSVFLKKDGVPGSPAKPDVFPQVQWVTIANGGREPGDMDDRAARYLADQNILRINGDFRAFTDMIDRWCKDLQGATGDVRERVTNAVHGWFEQSLVETVIGVQALLNSKEWTLDDVKMALSEEALTAAVMPRYHVYNSVKRELGSKLGKIESLVASAT
jgi:hypothetical protein